MKTCTISLYCKPMNVYNVDANTRRCDAEPMVATLDFGDHQLTVPDVVIPETLVDRIDLDRWRVRACVGATMDGAVPSLRVYLPPEDCIFDVVKVEMVAVQIEAETTYTAPDGKEWHGKVTFPDCKIDILSDPMVAEEVTATGILTLQE